MEDTLRLTAPQWGEQYVTWSLIKINDTICLSHNTLYFTKDVRCHIGATPPVLIRHCSPWLVRKFEKTAKLDLLSKNADSEKSH
jgi:hypothetical protein